ncbi:hypothetical protein LINGRAHAP2_LOCUS36931 [Linum grandiflorum]
MKLKNKGKKIFPSPSSSSSSAASSAADVPSILKLLPTAILALATVLSLDDREVLAYMITMSLKSTSSSSAAVPNKKPAKKSAATASNPPHKAPMFGCDCFDCYTSYWFRWDSSPNRELIHQAIEAFEEHLLSSEQQKSSSGSKKKKIRDKKEKTQLQLQLLPLPPPPSPPPAASDEAEAASSSPLQQISISPTQMAVEPEIHEVEEKEVALASPAVRDCGGGSGGGVGRKGIVRKVLPDVLGLLNSRLWSLWGPNL